MDMTVFILLLLFEIVYLRVARRRALLSIPGQRSSHSSPTVVGGGIVFVAAAVAAFLVTDASWPLMMTGLAVVAAVSFIDDLRPTPVSLRLLVQIVAVALMIADTGFASSVPPLVLVLIAFVALGMLNACNFMDGINGIAALYTLAVALPLAVAFGAAPVPAVWLRFTIMAALIFGFFNFRRHALCFAGDVGSISSGFILIFLLLNLIASTGEVWYAIFMIVYAVDAGLTVLHRLLLRRNIFRGHRMHLYQLLCNEAGLDHRAVALAYALLQLAVSFTAIMLPGGRIVFAICIAAVLCAVYISLVRRLFPLQQEAA